jgi:hypothetical protein
LQALRDTLSAPLITKSLHRRNHPLASDEDVIRQAHTDRIELPVGDGCCD